MIRTLLQASISFKLPMVGSHQALRLPKQRSWEVDLHLRALCNSKRDLQRFKTIANRGDSSSNRYFRQTCRRRLLKQIRRAALPILCLAIMSTTTQWPTTCKDQRRICIRQPRQTSQVQRGCRCSTPVITLLCPWLRLSHTHHPFIAILMLPGAWESTKASMNPLKDISALFHQLSTGSICILYQEWMRRLDWAHNLGSSTSTAKSKHHVKEVLRKDDETSFSLTFNFSQLNQLQQTSASP